MALTELQRDKLDRLVKLKITKEGEDLIGDPRVAVKIAFRMGLIKSWSDNGRFYTLDIPKVGVEKLRPHAVGEFIVDRILQVKDPLNETQKKESAEDNLEEEAEDNPEQEPQTDPSEVKGASGVGEAMSDFVETKKPDYLGFTNEELRQMCRRRGLTGFTTLKKSELADLLEMDDEHPIVP